MRESLTLLREIKDAANALGIAPSTLCQRAVKNGALAKRLQQPRSRASLETAAKIRAYIAKHLPRRDAAE